MADNDNSAMVAAQRMGDSIQDSTLRRQVLRSLSTHATPDLMVRAFHTLFQAPMRESPVKLSVTDRYRRLHFILSEFQELVTASGFELEIHEFADENHPAVMNLEHVEGSQQDIIEMTDGLCDIVYVCYGMALEMGIDLPKALLEVHASNITKLWPGGKVELNRCESEDHDDPANKHGCMDPSHRRLPHEPVGKVLKGPDYTQPKLERVLGISYMKEIPHA